MRIVFNSLTFKGVVVRSVIGIILGFVLVMWPTHVLNYTVKIIGAVFCITGIVSLIVSIREQHEFGNGLTSFTGVGSIILGALLWFMSNTFTNILMYVLGFILLFIGIGQLAAYSSAHKFVKVPFGAYLSPVIILAIGALIIVNPFETKATIIILFGVTSIFYGVTELINQYNINQMRKKMYDREQKERMGTDDIVEATYIEVGEEEDSDHNNIE